MCRKLFRAMSNTFNLVRHSKMLHCHQHSGTHIHGQQWHTKQCKQPTSRPNHYPTITKRAYKVSNEQQRKGICTSLPTRLAGTSTDSTQPTTTALSLLLQSAAIRQRAIGSKACVSCSNKLQRRLPCLLARQPQRLHRDSYRSSTGCTAQLSYRNTSHPSCKPSLQLQVRLPEMNPTHQPL